MGVSHLQVRYGMFLVWDTNFKLLDVKMLSN